MLGIKKKRGCYLAQWYRVGDSNPCFDSESVVT